MLRPDQAQLSSSVHDLVLHLIGSTQEIRAEAVADRGDRQQDWTTVLPLLLTHKRDKLSQRGLLLLRRHPGQGVLQVGGTEVISEWTALLYCKAAGRGGRSAGCSTTALPPISW